MNVISKVEPYTEISNERLLTRKEVEDIFGFPTKRYLEIAAMGDEGPPVVRFGRTVRYRVADLRTWIESHRASSCAHVRPKTDE